jgi:hypothetical protein
MRKVELKRHIAMIQDPNGSSMAMVHFNYSRHYSAHYRIPLSEVGYNGSLEDLRKEAKDSLIRAEERGKRATSGNLIPSEVNKAST